MMKNSNRIHVPFEYRSVIAPDVRARVFKEIYEGYPKRYSSMKLLYAFLNHNADLMIDYGIIYSARNNDDTGDLIVYGIEPIFSDRCTPAYRYYKNMHKTENFFQFGVEEMVVMDKNKFFEYLNQKLDLNRKKGDERYWRDPKNGEELCKGLLDLSLEYMKKDV